MDPWTAYAVAQGVGAFVSWWKQRQADKAAGRQVDQSREALALEERMFNAEQDYQKQTDEENKRRYENDQQRQDRTYADLEPYRAIGRSALSKLGFGVGIDLPANLTSTSLPPQKALLDTNGRVGTPGNGGGSLSTLGQPQTPPATPPATPPGQQNFSQGAMVNIRTPTGQIVLVPFSKVNEALANGGVRA